VDFARGETQQAVAGLAARVLDQGGSPGATGARGAWRDCRQ